MRHTGINGFEKPMDCAVIGSLMRTRFLPPPNPWLGGTLFTNYYYFGHLMAALPARLLSVPLPQAYNLVVATFAALFVAPLWSLCAALTESAIAGLLTMGVVALPGNF